ncbi:class I adenylate-forming enzyme family protein [Mycolicibacterium sp. XJ1819]
MSATIGSALSWWARTKPTTPAFVFDDTTLDWATVEHWSSRIAEDLRSSGVVTGDRVGLIGRNSPVWPVAALGVMKAGAVLVPLNNRFTPTELRKVLDDAGAAVVIADDTLTEIVTETSDMGAPLNLVSFHTIEELRDGGVSTFRVDREEHEPTAIIFTSGSTGRSKGVVFTNRSLLNIVFEASLVEEGFHSGSTSIVLVQLAFLPGLIFGVLMSTVLGGTLVIERELVPSRAVRLIEEHRVEALFGVPLLYQQMASTPEFAAADLSSIRTAIVGGAPVPVPLLQRWAEKEVALRQIYGMTEAGGTATATLAHEFREHPDSCGIGNVFTDVKVVRADGTDAAVGETGELVVRGPCVAPGYWDASEIDDETFRDGWLHTGDLGTVDEQGRITFVDRMKDVIITGGINVSPVELEQVVGAIDGVVECAVIAAPDPKFGETPAAIVHARDGVTETVIIAECAKALADYKVPRYVVLAQEPLPRLATGKISKVAIRTQYLHLAEQFPRVR